MLVIDNRTPFAAERTILADRNGALTWIVVVKATFDIAPDGATPISEEQPPVCQEPEYRGEPGASSLVYDNDMVLTKPTTDVVLNGHACAPRGKPAFQIDVTMKVADLVKALRVTGDHVWEEGLAGPKMSDPKPFATMPITYERAYGGGDDPNADLPKARWERRNPVGTGFPRSAEGLVGQAVPNVEYPDGQQSRARLKPRPAGFGPIACHWVPRVDFAGTYDEKWQKKRAPLLPHDFDDRFYQFAPDDQRPPQYLRGGEPVVLLNLTPNGSLSFTLPQMWLTFSTTLGKEIIDHRANLHTVLLEPDTPRVSMIWHTSLPCHGKETKLEKTIVTLKEFHTFSR